MLSSEFVAASSESATALNNLSTLSADVSQAPIRCSSKLSRALQVSQGQLPHPSEPQEGEVVMSVQLAGVASELIRCQPFSVFASNVPLRLGRKRKSPWFGKERTHSESC